MDLLNLIGPDCAFNRKTGTMLTIYWRRQCFQPMSHAIFEV